MKIFDKASIGSLALSGILLASPFAALAASPATVNLGSAGNFVVLAKTGVSTTGTTAIVGDIGLSPAAATYLTGFSPILPSASAFSTSALVTGKIHASDYSGSTPSNLTTAVLNMETAYTDASGRASNFTELGAGNIGGLTLVSGVYKWGTSVTIPTNVTISGGANDVWIFQIGGNLSLGSSVKVILAGGAQSSNIFWVVAGQTTLGTTSELSGTVLGQTAIILNTGAKLTGRALAQTAVTLDSNAVTLSAPVVSAQATVVASSSVQSTSSTSTSPVTVAPSIAATSTLTSTGTSTPTLTSAATSTTSSAGQTSVSVSTPASSNASNVALEAQLNSLRATAQSLLSQLKAKQQGSSSTASAFGQSVKTIANSLGQGGLGSDVSILQQFLISENKGPSAKALAEVGATAYFGPLTRAALAEFQAKVGINPALGNFGAITRAYINANY